MSVGDQAPDFCLPDASEREVCLKDFRGKWVILYFYPKDNTSGCTTEAVDFTRHLPDYHALNAVVVGISPDSCQSHRKFIDKFGLKVQLLSDPDQRVLKQYGVWQKKKMYGREYMGVVRSTFLIDPEGKVAYIWPKVKVAGHADAVLKKLQELQKK
ncbi:MAG: thioredoxin-dependent thiol peroxidase [Calditrichaeota bacterium]|nr:thioredoxin-dependent thiol peroxidase [Calditrichota bacterium]